MPAFKSALESLLPILEDAQKCLELTGDDGGGESNPTLLSFCTKAVKTVNETLNFFCSL